MAPPTVTIPELETALQNIFGPGSPFMSAIGSGGTRTPASPATPSVPGAPSSIPGSIDITQVVGPTQQTILGTISDFKNAAIKKIDEAGEVISYLDQAAGSAVEPLRMASLSIQESFGGFRKANEKMSIDASQNLRDSYDNFANMMVSSTQELRDMGKEKYVLNVDGADVNILSDIFQDANEYQAQFHDLVVEFKDTYGPAIAEGLKDNMADVALFQKNFGLSSKSLGDFLGKEIAATGEASTTMLDDLKKFSYGLSAQTGISAKLIAKDTVSIVNNVKQFGNVTVEEAARMSTSLKQLGVDYSQLSGMVGAFQGFDTAAQKVGNLSAVFGIHLDAVEMMNLANTDQEAMMHKLRDAFDASGQSLDDMNIAQKNLLAEQAGFSDVRQMEMFFSGQADSMEELQEMTDAASEETAVTDAVEAFNQDLATLALQGESAAQRVAKAKEDLVYSLQSVAPEIMDFRSSIQTGLGVVSDETRGVLNEATTQVDVVKDAMLDAAGVLGGSGEGSMADIAVKTAEGFESSFTRIGAGFSNTFEQLKNIYEQSDFKSSSPSPIGLQLANGIILPLDMVHQKFNDIIEKAEATGKAASNIIKDSGLPDATNLVNEGAIVATATVSELLSSHIEKIEEVQQLVDAPDKILDLLSNIGEMKNSVERLIDGLETTSKIPIKINYESNGRAEDALFNVLKDYISVSGGQVMLNYQVE